MSKKGENRDKLIETFVGHSDKITSVVLSSPSSLISSSDDSSVKFWQINVPSTEQVTACPKTTSHASVPTRSIALQADYHYLK